MADFGNTVLHGSTPLFTPTTANAATEIGNGTMYVSAVTNGEPADRKLAAGFLNRM